jgi:multidrug efflux pump subunit AcrB
MNFNFSAWSIRHPVPPILAFFVLMLVGIFSFRSLPITQFPNIDVPVILVSVGQSGATPAELETQVTKKIEDAVAAITGVKHISSTINDGASNTGIEFNLSVPTDKALEDVKDAVSKVRGNLPGGVDEPIVQRIDVEGQAIQTYAVSAPGMTLEQLSWYVDDVVKRQLQGLSGVGRVDRFGGADREIRVDLDPQKLQALGVTAASINGQLAATNADFGAGRGDVGNNEQAIRTLGGAKSLDELRETKIALPGGRQTKLGDLGKVIDSTSELRSFARYNGDGVVTFSIFRSKGSSSTAVGDRVGAKVAEIQAASKGAAKFTLVDDTVYFIYGNYTSAMETLIEGAILSVLVVLLFLRDWRATLISALALPLSAVPTFWVMGLMGFSLNLVSFLGLTLATGILVDDAIVEIENIARHMRMGKSPYRAAMEAADEIGLAVIAITFSIVSIFVPVSFMSGIVGQYFKQFGLTVAVAVLFSLLVARFITPMMAAYLMRPTHHEEHKPGLLLRGYIRLLHVLNWAPTIGRNTPVTAHVNKMWDWVAYGLAAILVLIAAYLSLNVVSESPKLIPIILLTILAVVATVTVALLVSLSARSLAGFDRVRLLLWGKILLVAFCSAFSFALFAWFTTDHLSYFHLDGDQLTLWKDKSSLFKLFQPTAVITSILAFAGLEVLTALVLRSRFGLGLERTLEWHDNEGEHINTPRGLNSSWPRVMSYITVVGAFGILFGSTLLIPLLPKGFIPPGDNSRFVLSVELPPGSRLEQTRETTDAMAKIIKANAEVSQVFVLGGSSPTGSIEPRNASIFVNLRHRDVGLLTGIFNPTITSLNKLIGVSLPLLPADGRTKPQEAIEAEILPLLSTLPDLRWAKINDRGERDVRFNILSNDPKALDEAVGRLEAALRKEPKLRAPAAEGGLDRPEIQIIPKSAEAAKLGITAQQISQTVRVATIGDFGPLLAKFSIGDRQIPIRVQIPEVSRTKFDEISNLRVVTSTGESVPLSAVADVSFSRGPSSVKRYDRERQATIGADVPPGVQLGEAADLIKATAKSLNFPPSVVISEGGDAEVQNEVFTEFGKSATLGIVLMLVVLVLLLGDVFQPFAILFSLPLCIGGVVFALLATHNAFSMPVVIGMLMLIGIVAKNAIMLIDFAVERKKHGLARIDAIVDAGRKRARPIVMTTIAMGAGMLPSAFGIGEGGSFRAPMAIAVIGGLIAATFLSLIFVPSFYIVMDDVSKLFTWIFSRFAGATDEAAIHDPRLEKIEAEVTETSDDVDELAAKILSVESKMEDLAKQLPKQKPKLKLAAE